MARKLMGIASPVRGSLPLPFRNRHAGHDLLLIVVCVRTIVKRAHRSGVLCGRRRGIPKVISDESLAVTDAMRMRCIQLWVPGMRRQADVVTNGSKCCGVKLDCRVDAVVGAPVGSAGRNASAGIESNSSSDGFRGSRCGTGQATIIESNADRVADAVIGNVQIRLEFVHWTGIVV